MIRELLPDDVEVVEATPAMWSAPLHPEEARAVARAVPKRVREFAAGRACSRGALDRLGVPSSPLVPGPDRAPRWPARVVGSITHCEGYCASAVALTDRVAMLGIDAEVDRPLPAGVARLVCSPEEAARLPDGLGWATVIFSAKEAVYKAWFPATGLFLDFLDVEIAIRPDEGTFGATLVNAGLEDRANLVSGLVGRFCRRSGLVLTSAVSLVGSGPAPLQVEA